MYNKKSESLFSDLKFYWFVTVREKYFCRLVMVISFMCLGFGASAQQIDRGICPLSDESINAAQEIIEEEVRYVLDFLECNMGDEELGHLIAMIYSSINRSDAEVRDCIRVFHQAYQIKYEQAGCDRCRTAYEQGFTGLVLIPDDACVRRIDHYEIAMRIRSLVLASMLSGQEEEPEEEQAAQGSPLVGRWLLIQLSYASRETIMPTGDMHATYYSDGTYEVLLEGATSLGNGTWRMSADGNTLTSTRESDGEVNAVRIDFSDNGDTIEVIDEDGNWSLWTRVGEAE